MFATFEEFFLADYRRLIGFLINLGYYEDVAENAATDAMVIACHKWTSLESPRAWVRKVARNRAEKIREYEAKGDQIMLMIMETGRRIVPEDDPERHWLLYEEAGWVARALACLPPHQRLVMALYLDGFSTAEIAREIGAKQNTIRSHLRHARHQLRNLYGGSKW